MKKGNIKSNKAEFKVVVRIEFRARVAKTRPLGVYGCPAEHMHKFVFKCVWFCYLETVTLFTIQMTNKNDVSLEFIIFFSIA